MALNPVDRGVARIHHLAELNTEQIRSLDRAQTVVLLPGGILEEHGPYLPCYTDGYGSEYVTEHLAKTIVNRPGWSALIFPIIPLGTSGANGIGGKHSFPGTYAVRAKTVRAVYMDLASELGEQGFRWVFVVHHHFGPRNHNRALHQACAYFDEVYGGRMAHLMGLLNMSILEGVLSAEDQEAAGLDIHAGTAETSWMLHVHPGLVDPTYKEAPPQSGKNGEELRRIAQSPDWPGYLGAPACAQASYGAALAEKIVATVTALALQILDGEEPDAIARNDRTPLQDEAWAPRREKEWLEQNGLV